MVERLKLVLKTTQLQLILKTFAFAGLLYWVRISDFAIPVVILFSLLSFIFYFKTYHQNSFENIFSFLALLIASLSTTSLLAHFEFLIPAIIFFSFIFYLILALKDFVLPHRYEWNYVKNLLLLYSVFIGYFLSNKYDLFFVKFLAVFIIVYFVIQEWLLWLGIDFPRRRRLISIVFSFLALQFVWAVSLLPLGFINSALLITLFVYLMFSFCVNHLNGTLNKKLVIGNLIILASSLFVIFFFTNFTI
ncbi:hypothetical protein KJ671_01555 [Patescibacteria group bacterium]|nr:hypothetical protein [Patescibacteria group bacterium]